MRTDVKIGIVVGLLVIGGFVIYFFFTGGEEKPVAPPSGVARTEGDTHNRVEPRPGVPGAKPPGADVKPAFAAPRPGEGVEPAKPAPGPGDTVVPRISVGVTPPTVKPAGPGLEIGEPTRAAPGPAIARVEPPVRPTIPLVEEPRDVDTVKPAIPIIERAEAAGAERTYVVQQGDNFWAIAEKVYGLGSGRHWDVIAKANPDVDAGHLPPGRKLRIPPLPAAVTPGAGLVTGIAPEGAAAPADSKSYVVKAEDKGLWSVAEKMYGNGSYWTLIAKANPKADTNRLRVGQVLVIPPKPAPVAPRSSAMVARGRGAAVEPAPRGAPARGQPPDDGRPWFD